MFQSLKRSPILIDSLLFLLTSLLILLPSRDIEADIYGWVYEGRLEGGSLVPIAGADIIVRSPDGEIERVKSNGEGFYQISGDLSGYDLEAFAPGHWGVLLHNIENGEYNIILPTRNGELSNMKTFNHIPNAPNGVIAYALALGLPIKVYFWENHPDPWPENFKQAVIDRLNYHEQITGIDLYEIVNTVRTSYEYGMNISYAQDGVSSASTFYFIDDINNITIYLTNVTLNSAAMYNIMDKELITGVADPGVPDYTPTCAISPPYPISDKDVKAIQTVVWFRPVFLKVRGEHPGSVVTTLADLIESEAPVGVEMKSWGFIKGIFR